MTCPTISVSALMRGYAVAIGSMLLPRSAVCTFVLMGHMLSVWLHKDHADAHLDLLAVSCAMIPGTKDAKICGRECNSTA